MKGRLFGAVEGSVERGKAWLHDRQLAEWEYMLNYMFSMIFVLGTRIWLKKGKGLVLVRETPSAL